ncbi:4Fe-4S dicluster domain-containing protein [Desulfurobacterium thermolithotrophum]|uniref:4Fe-4S dicluster domain-containing protein n=1 Tax=Desulfurobacterium thermolithotrophum TaxID=64160 RepID=UPI0013D3370B|nr:4Fe-4S dicluster domain-containing protein [Desulfurobacterium thermolithotrophum]
MEFKDVIKIPAEVVKKLIRITKAVFRPKATEVWLDKDIKRDYHYRGKHIIKAEICIGCGLCARTCPVKCIEMIPTGVKKPRAIPRVKANECMFCGFCEDVCPAKPEKAIKLTDIYTMYVEPGTWDNLSKYVFEAEDFEKAIEKAKKLEEMLEKKKQEALEKRETKGEQS